jgi:hypothetical protein
MQAQLYDSRDRPVIEITPAMIEAGEMALIGSDLDGSRRDSVLAVLQASLAQSHRLKIVPEE